MYSKSQLSDGNCVPLCITRKVFLLVLQFALNQSFAAQQHHHDVILLLFQLSGIYEPIVAPLKATSPSRIRKSLLSWSPV